MSAPGPAGGELARLAALSAAFWVALALPLRAPALRPHGTRLLFGLALGAAAAHLGWAALHAPTVLAAPALALDPTRGQSLLFVPLGLLAAAPRGARRRTFLDPALGAQPVAWAVAKLGCFAAGCCGGPLALGEAAAYLTGGALVARSRAPAALALALLGAVRLASACLRPETAASPLLAPLLAPGWVAAAWLAVGAAGARRRAHHPTPRPWSFQNGSRRTRFRILPEPVRGSSGTACTERGIL